MTDKRWHQLQNIQGVKHTVCHHPKGNFCTAYRNRKCIALCNTIFHDKNCPFFRDTTEMSGEELEEYNGFVESLATTGRY